MEEGNPLYLDLLGSGDELSFYPYNGCYPKGEYQLAGGGSPERYDEELLLSALCFSQPTRCTTKHWGKGSLFPMLVLCYFYGSIHTYVGKES